MATEIKPVLVKRSVYTNVIDPEKLIQYIDNSKNLGSTADLFKDPHIASTFYTEGSDLAVLIKKKIDIYEGAPLPGNRTLLELAMDDGKNWLNRYALQVETISNSDANRTTREQAFGNIQLSYLTPHKIVISKKGVPETPKLDVEVTSPGNIAVSIINGATYQPTQTNFVVVKLPPASEPQDNAPVVSLKNGQVTIVSKSAGESVTSSVTGKGRNVKLQVTPMNRYAVYAYAQNGKKQVSELSVPIIVIA